MRARSRGPPSNTCVASRPTLVPVVIADPRIARLAALAAVALRPPPGPSRIILALSFGIACHAIFAAAVLAMTGVLVLFWPALWASPASATGEILGLFSSVLWTLYGRECRAVGRQLSGAAITAHTMWRAGVLLLPVAGIEVIWRGGLAWRWELIAVQSMCIVAGGVIAYSLWANALRHWQTSEVYLFNNLIPISSTLWAHAWLKEPITPTFWVAMVLIVSGVLLGQANWQRLFGARWLPME